jgi:hypothetical protein
LGSIVQNGKFAACAFAFDRQLKRVDFPTFGNPTIPHCKAMYSTIEDAFEMHQKGAPILCKDKNYEWLFLCGVYDNSASSLCMEYVIGRRKSTLLGKEHFNGNKNKNYAE